MGKQKEGIKLLHPIKTNQLGLDLEYQTVTNYNNNFRNI